MKEIVFTVAPFSEDLAARFAEERNRFRGLWPARPTAIWFECFYGDAVRLREELAHVAGLPETDVVCRREKTLNDGAARVGVVGE